LKKIGEAQQSAQQELQKKTRLSFFSPITEKAKKAIETVSCSPMDLDYVIC